MPVRQHQFYPVDLIEPRVFLSTFEADIVLYFGHEQLANPLEGLCVVRSRSAMNCQLMLKQKALYFG